MARSTRGRSLIAAVVSAGCICVGAAPAQAASTTYCVQKPSCSGTPKTGLQGALDSAQNHPGPDRIEVGQGTFASSDPYHYLGSGANTLDLVGSGTALTRLLNTSSGDITTLSVVNATVSGLEIVGPAGTVTDFPTALDLDGTAHDIVTTGGFTGVVLRNGAVLRSSEVVGSGLDIYRPAVVLKGASASVLDSTVVSNNQGVAATSPGHLIVSRTSIHASSPVVATEGGEVDIDNSLIRGPGNFVGLAAYAYAKSATVVATNVTIA